MLSTGRPSIAFRPAVMVSNSPRAVSLPTTPMKSPTSGYSPLRCGGNCWLPGR